MGMCWGNRMRGSDAGNMLGSWMNTPPSSGGRSGLLPTSQHGFWFSTETTQQTLSGRMSTELEIA